MDDKVTWIPIDEWRKKVCNTLVQDARTLIEVDRKVIKAIVESDFEKIGALTSEFRNQKVKVQKGLAELGVVNGVDDSVKELLVRVQGKFATDSLIEQLENDTGKSFAFYELSEEEEHQIASDLFYSWICGEDYVRDMFKVNTVIFQAGIPNALRQYIFEARNCFALQQYNTAISMCRTILEAAAKNLCEMKGIFGTQVKNVVEINPKVFNQLIRTICGGKLKRRAIRVYYRDACPVVHGDRSIDADDSLSVLRETLNVVQELYSIHESTSPQSPDQKDANIPVEP